MGSITNTPGTHMEFFGYEQLRYGYFWPYPNTPKVEVARQPSLEDVDREMDGRDTIREMPVFAMVVSNEDPEPAPIQNEVLEAVLASFDDVSPLPAPLPPIRRPIVAQRIIMLSEDPNADAVLLAEIESGWDA